MIAANEELEQLKNRQKIRYSILKGFFDQTEGRRLVYVQLNSLSISLKIDFDDAKRAAEYLRDEGLIEVRGSGYHYCITHSGILEVETAIEHPDGRTKHFMATVIQHFHAPVSAVQTGNDNRVEVAQVTSSHIDRIVADLDAELKNLSLREKRIISEHIIKAIDNHPE